MRINKSRTKIIVCDKDALSKMRTGVGSEVLEEVEFFVCLESSRGRRNKVEVRRIIIQGKPAFN